jgi:hypothetical protein
LKPPHPVPNTTTRGNVAFDDVSVVVVVSLVVDSVRNALLDNRHGQDPSSRWHKETAVVVVLVVVVNNKERNMIALFENYISFGWSPVTSRQLHTLHTFQKKSIGGLLVRA